MFVVSVVEPTCLLEWPVVDVEQIDPSLSLSDLLFVESFLGILSEVFCLKNNDTDSCPPSWSRLLDVDVLLGNLAVAVEELDNLAHLDLEWEPSDQQGLVTVVISHFFSEVVSPTRLWTATSATTASSSATKSLGY